MDISDISLDLDIATIASCICECDECDRTISERYIICDCDISTEDDDGAFCFDSSASIELCDIDTMISIHDKIVHIIVVRPIARKESCLFPDRADEIDSSTCSTTDSLARLSEDLDSLSTISG